MNWNSYKTPFFEAKEELILRFGEKRLEETAFPAYFNKLPLASFLGWSRVFAGQRLL